MTAKSNPTSSARRASRTRSRGELCSHINVYPKSMPHTSRAVRNDTKSVASGRRTATGFTLSDGMEIPDEGRALRVREAEVETGREDPWFVLRDRGRRLIDAAPGARGQS